MEHFRSKLAGYQILRPEPLAVDHCRLIGSGGISESSSSCFRFTVNQQAETLFPSKGLVELI